MSLDWIIVRRRADARIEELRTALETAPTDRIAALQGELRAWREIVRLPETLRVTSDKDLEPPTSGYV